MIEKIIVDLQIKVPAVQRTWELGMSIDFDILVVDSYVKHVFPNCLKKTKDIHRCDLKRAIIRCMDANMFSANMFAIDR